VFSQRPSVLSTTIFQLLRWMDCGVSTLATIQRGPLPVSMTRRGNFCDPPTIGGKQGYLGLKGVAWYRFQVNIPPNTPTLSLLLPVILTNYEVYANGVMVGGCGEMPPHPEGRCCHAAVVTLPAAVYRTPG
jgi:hypothetical protein